MQSNVFKTFTDQLSVTDSFTRSDNLLMYKVDHVLIVHQATESNETLTRNT